MIFNNHKNSIHHSDVLIGQKKITKVHSTKFLGVEIDDKLTWVNHTKLVEKKLSFANFILRNIRYKINKNTAFKLYDSLVLPHLIYCNAIWGNAYKTYTLNIFRLQKRILRLCCDEKSLSRVDLFIKSNKLSFYNLNKFQTAQLVFKFFHNVNILPNSTASLFKKISDVHHFHTRSLDALCLFNHFAKLNTRKSSVKIHAPALWNEIPEYIRKISTIKLFKKTYKAFIQANSDD